MLRSGLCRRRGAEMMAGERDNSRSSCVTMADRMDPLLFAAAWGFPLLVKFQIARNKDINSHDVFGRTALHLAVLSGHIEIIRILLKRGAKVNVEDPDGYTPLCYAILRQSSEMVELLIKAGATPSDRNCLLHFSVKRKNFNITKLLLSSGSNPNLRDGNQDTPLMIPATKNDIAITTILLGAGYTPLCYAILRQSSEMVELLIKAGATPSDRNCLLHFSVKRKNFNITKLLLSSGSNPNLRDGNQDTPLMIPATKNDIAITTILLGAGRDEILDLLLMYSADVKLQDVDGRTALHRAVEAGHIGIVKRLCQLCPELVHIRDKYNKLSYDYAIGKNSIQEALSKFS